MLSSTKSQNQYQKTARSIVSILFDRLERDRAWRRPFHNARPNINADAFLQGADVDTSSVVVQLKGEPLSTYPATKPAAGRKIDFNSNAVRSYRAQLNTGRNEFRQWLRSNAPGSTVTTEYDISLNGVAAQLNGTPL